MSKASFLYRVMKAYMRRQDKSCPYCGYVYSKFVGRRRIVLQLRKCSVCNLMFRWPKDTIELNKEFYQSKYREKGLTTDIPEAELLENLKKTNFRGTEKDFSEKIAILKELVPYGKVLDFGCSWGYGTYQLQTAGYNAVGFEISKPRSEFGRNHLDVKIIDEYSDLDKIQPSSFDIIFSSHVLEHLPSLKGVFERFSFLLKSKGMLVLFVPNCGGENARKYGWGHLVHEKHPLALDRLFFETVLPKYGFCIKSFSEPYNPKKIKSYISGNNILLDPCGDELLVCALKVEK
jgi:2-polyprenyl-3-methyl-5-hydroxy-6-metoxy-1,4-benzoquinol methylase